MAFSVEAFESPLANLSFEVPKVRLCAELSQKDVKGLWIESEKWCGRQTYVFAYRAVSGGIS